jgi:hypothetical protein
MSSPDFNWQADPTEQPATSAKIIPFPMARRKRFLDWVAIEWSHSKKPDLFLARTENQQRDAMARRQLSKDVIEEQIAIFHKEIDWRMEWIKKHHA